MYVLIKIINKRQFGTENVLLSTNIVQNSAETVPSVKRVIAVSSFIRLQNDSDEFDFDEFDSIFSLIQLYVIDTLVNRSGSPRAHLLKQLHIKIE